MTNLTEKWKKGELPRGQYYVKVIPDFEYSYDIAFYTGESFELYSDKDIEQVLAPVPSYEQWQDKLNENNKLKELLKDCREWFDWYHIDTGAGKEYIESWHKKGREIHQKINQVLGEE